MSGERWALIGEAGAVEEEEEKKPEGCEGEDVSEGLVEGLGVVDVDG
jgi:hypothetical protein